MPVYIDELFVALPAKEAQAKRVGARNQNQWCHMWCNAGDEDELHLIAKKIGMRRSWFQDRPGFPHYDLVPSRRVRALVHGATPTSLRDWIKEKHDKQHRETSNRITSQ